MLYYIHIDILCKVKVKKVEFTLEQAMEAQKGSSYSSTLSLTSALDRVVVSATLRPLYPWERDPVPIA